MSSESKHLPLACSFCGKTQTQVRRLLAGPSVNICDRCVGANTDKLLTESRATEGTCAFCGKDAQSVPLASGAHASICGECLGLAREIIQIDLEPPRELESYGIRGLPYEQPEHALARLIRGAVRAEAECSELAFKYHGIGNDFVILDRRKSGEDIDAATSVRLCDRRRGLGGDGVLVMLPSSKGFAKMVVHNADGSIAEMCGNGLRCAVKYLVDHGEGRPEVIHVETGAGVLECAITYDAAGVREVEVDMGPARLVAPNLPSGKTGSAFVDAPVPGHPELRGTAVSMGNPHLVLSNARVEDVEKIGPILERHPDFPDRTNVEFVRQDGNHLTVAVWERGSGYTQACGTGACATVAAWVHRGLLPADTWIPVDLPGGQLKILVAVDLSNVKLRGPAEFVFTAQVQIRP